MKWLKENNYKGILGEFGVPANPDRNPRWLVILNNVYAYFGENNAGRVSRCRKRRSSRGC